MAKRLTSYMREQIVRAVLTHRFSDEIVDLTAQRAAFANDVYDDVYRKADREKMASLPKGWLPESDAISVSFGETGRFYAVLAFNGETPYSVSQFAGERRKEVRRRMMEKHLHGCCKVYAPDHRLTTRYHEICRTSETLTQRIREALRQVEAALGATSSISALIKAWPEIEPFVKPYYTAPVKLPAIPAATLNEALKLPVSEAA